RTPPGPRGARTGAHRGPTPQRGLRRAGAPNAVLSPPSLPFLPGFLIRVRGPQHGTAGGAGGAQGQPAHPAVLLGGGPRPPVVAPPGLRSDAVGPPSAR